MTAWPNENPDLTIDLCSQMQLKDFWQGLVLGAGGAESNQLLKLTMPAPTIHGKEKQQKTNKDVQNKFSGKLRTE